MYLHNTYGPAEGRRRHLAGGSSHYLMQCIVDSYCRSEQAKYAMGYIHICYLIFAYLPDCGLFRRATSVSRTPSSK
jgi:hypothetical protein